MNVSNAGNGDSGLEGKNVFSVEVPIRSISSTISIICLSAGLNCSGGFEWSVSLLFFRSNFLRVDLDILKILKACGPRGWLLSLISVKQGRALSVHRKFVFHFEGSGLFLPSLCFPECSAHCLKIAKFPIVQPLAEPCFQGIVNVPRFRSIQRTPGTWFSSSFCTNHSLKRNFFSPNGLL